MPPKHPPTACTSLPHTCTQLCKMHLRTIHHHASAADPFQSSTTMEPKAERYKHAARGISVELCQKSIQCSNLLYMFHTGIIVADVVSTHTSPPPTNAVRCSEHTTTTITRTQHTQTSNCTTGHLCKRLLSPPLHCAPLQRLANTACSIHACSQSAGLCCKFACTAKTHCFLYMQVCRHV